MGIKKYALTAVACTVGISGGLAVLGAVIGSEWGTFVPDLLVGIVGAGFISTVIAAVQQRASNLADRRAEQTSAYLQLLADITEVRDFRPDKDGTGILARLATSMIVFAEVVDKDFPALPAWFEAERQLIVYNFGLSLERWPNRGRSVEDDFKALEPVFKWTRDFSGNVRLWRNGKLTNQDAAGQAQLIERLLREENAWVENRQ